MLVECPPVVEVVRGPDEVGEVEEPLGGGEVPGVGLLAPQTLCRSYKLLKLNLRSRRCTFLLVLVLS